MNLAIRKTEPVCPDSVKDCGDGGNSCGARPGMREPTGSSVSVNRTQDVPDTAGCTEAMPCSCPNGLSHFLSSTLHRLFTCDTNVDNTHGSMCARITRGLLWSCQHIHIHVCTGIQAHTHVRVCFHLSLSVNIQSVRQLSKGDTIVIISWMKQLRQKVLAPDYTLVGPAL